MTEIPHVLVITDPGDGYEKEWEVIHPPECPRACAWFPPENGEPWFAKYERNLGIPVRSEREGDHTCYMRHELDGNGIDSLAVVSYRERDESGGWRDVGEFIDPDYVPDSTWEPEWKRLRPGRYLIKAWFTPFYWAGSEPVDADAGLTLLGFAPEEP